MFAEYQLGEYPQARALGMEREESDPYRTVILALIEHKLGRQAEAEALLAKLQASCGDGCAYYYAQTYAQWGSTAKALEWLERALRLRDMSLEWLRTDPLFDSLRQEPRFQAVERALNFPA